MKPGHFVIPTGFRGAIKIVGNDPHGVVPNEKDGVFLYEVPHNSVLRLKGVLAFSSWQEATASYSDGSRLPTGTELIAPPCGQTNITRGNEPIALWVLFTNEKGELWLYVGTLAESHAAQTGQLTPGERVIAK